MCLSQTAPKDEKGDINHRGLKKKGRWESLINQRFGQRQKKNPEVLGTKREKTSKGGLPEASDRGSGVKRYPQRLKRGNQKKAFIRTLAKTSPLM